MADSTRCAGWMKRGPDDRQFSQRFSSVSAISIGALRKSRQARHTHSACCARESVRGRAVVIGNAAHAAPDRRTGLQPGHPRIAARLRRSTWRQRLPAAISVTEVLLYLLQPGDRRQRNAALATVDAGCSAIRWAWSAWGAGPGLLAMDLLPAAINTRSPAPRWA